MMNWHIFREYDIRGVVGEDLTDDVVRDLGRAFSSYVLERKGTVVSLGRDCRLSSDHLRDLLLEGMLEGGLHVIDLGVVPTPLFYFSLFKLPVQGGLMITGSHNPPEFNGFKVAWGRTTIFGDEIKYLGRIMEQRRFYKGEGKLEVYRNIVEDYYEFLRRDIRIERPLKVVVDAGNGTAGVVACPIMKELGVTVVELFCEMDGRFPNHFPDPTVEAYMVSLQEAVVKERAHVGIGFDGDGDRIGVVDEKGDIIYGDYLMMIFARDILRLRKHATFVSEVKCSENLFRDIEEHGGRAIMWKTGHSLIKDKMKETGAVLAGEMSGHMFFADRYFGYDDAIYASLRLLEIVSREGKSLSELLGDVRKTYATPEIRIECPDAIKFKVVDRIREEYRKRFRLVDIDGVRFYIDGGWGLVRPSNTQPVLVLRFEADTEEAVERMKDMVEKDIGRAIRDLKGEGKGTS